MNEKKKIYLDCAATTPLDERVLAAMEPYLKQDFGNASSPHSMGHLARRAIDQARQTVAQSLHCAASEIIFTAGGTESDNIAILGAAREATEKLEEPGHIITTNIEHPAVLDTCNALAKQGFELTVVKVEESGLVDPAKAAAVIQDNTVLVTVILANNEIGTVQPIAEIAQAVKNVREQIMVHSDACQAARAMELNVQKLGVDLLTINASKVYGPKGMGALYIKQGTKLQPIMYGGGHEQGLRPGTENVAGIVGFAKAIELAEQEREEEIVRLTQLRDQLIDGILKKIPGTELNGDREQRLPNNVNIFIKDIDGESLLMFLDDDGVQASLGSACAAGSLEPSHVIMALGRSKQDARQSLRLTLGKDTTEKDIQYILAELPQIVAKIRKR